MLTVNTARPLRCYAIEKVACQIVQADRAKQAAAFDGVIKSPFGLCCPAAAEHCIERSAHHPALSNPSIDSVSDAQIMNLPVKAPATGGIVMTVYMVERDLQGISMNDLANSQGAAIAKAQEMTSAGTDIRYIRSTFAPGDGRCMCLFEANSANDVKRLNDDCGLPYNSVVEALDLTPPER